MLQGQSRLTGQTRAESVTPAAMRPTIPIGVIDASKLPSVRGKAIPSGKLGTPVRAFWNAHYDERGFASMHI
jgi:hypothetical protein